MAAHRQKTTDPEDRHLLEEAQKIVEALGKMFAPSCEVVLHDLTNPTHSILAIENALSGRKVGDSTTEMGLARIQNRKFPDIVQNYANHFPDGRLAKSTSIGLKNRKGKFVAAICLNLDVSLFSSVQLVLEKLTSTTPSPALSQETLRHRSPDEVRQAIDLFAAAHSTQPRALVASQRRELIRQLSEKGMLHLRGAIAVITEQLGISRASVYNALKNER